MSVRAQGAGAIRAVCIVLSIALSVRCAAARDTSLVQLAGASFPELTHAELALIQFADIDMRRGEFAIAGTSSNGDDPSNDPAQAAAWGHEREIRGELIRWLCSNPNASRLVDPGGIRILGARIVGDFDLSYRRIPFPIVMHRCKFSNQIKLVATEIPHLDLDGSYVGEINAKGLIAHSDLNLGHGFHADDETMLENARVEGDLDCSGGSFTHSATAMNSAGSLYHPALEASGSTIVGTAFLCCGFHADGATALWGTSVGGGLLLFGARLSNPGTLALIGNSAEINGGALLGAIHRELGVFEINGQVDFTTARIKPYVVVSHARFDGARGDGHGFSAPIMVVDGAFVWNDVDLRNGAQLDLSGAKVSVLVDQEKSWPEPGALHIEGFTYGGFGPDSPSDVQSRIRWIGLQGPGFHSMAFSQLASVYKSLGFERQATEVLIAKEDARYSSSGVVGWWLGAFLKWTIAYGHRPMLALFWSLAVVLIGWSMVSIGQRAGVMRATWPDSPPPSQQYVYEKLHPLLYSFDVFLPFVNLHQEHYWWPDAERSGDCTLFGKRLRISGAFIRYYLWMQVIAGWLLSAIFVAGVTGLMRND